MKRLFIIGLVLVLFLSGSMLGAVRWLTHTQSGAMWLIGMSAQIDDVEVKYQSLTGTISDGLILRSLDMQVAGYQVEAEQFELQLSWALFPRTLSVERLTTGSMTVHLAAPSTEPPDNSGAIRFANLQSTTLIRLNDVSLNDVTIVDSNALAVWKLQSLQLSGSLHESLLIDQLAANSEQGRARVHGGVFPNNSEPLQLDLQVETDHSAVLDWFPAGFAVSAQITGDDDRLQLRAESELTALLLTGEVSQWQSDWQAEMNLNSPGFALQYSDGQSLTLNQLNAVFQADNERQTANMTGELLAADWVPEMKPLSWSASMEHHNGLLSVENLSLNAPYVEASISGSIEVAQASSANVQARVERAQWPINTSSPDVIVQQGEFTIGGQPDDWQADGRLSITTKKTPQGVFSVIAQGDETTAQGRIHEGAVLGGTITGQFDVDWSENGLYSAEFGLLELDLSALNREWPQRVTANALLEYYSARQWLLDIESLSGAWRGGEFLGQGVIKQHGTDFEFTDVLLTEGASSVGLNGGFNHPDGVLLVADIQPTGWLGEQLGAGLKGRAQLSPDWQDPDRAPFTELDIGLIDGKWNGWSMDSAQITRLEPSAERLWGVEVTLSNLETPGGVLDAASVSLDQAGRELNLQFNAEMDSQQLTATVLGTRPTWDVSDPFVWQGELSHLNLLREGEHLAQLQKPAGISFNTPAANLTGACLALTRGGLVCLDAANTRDNNWSVALELQSVTMAVLDDWMANDIVLTQGISGTLTWEQPQGGLPSGRADLLIAAGSLGERGDENGLINTLPGALAFNMQGGDLKSGRFYLPLVDYGEIDLNFEVNGVNLRGDGQINGDLQVNLRDLSLIESFTEGIDNVSGSALTRIKVTGQTGDLTLIGGTKLEQARFEIPAFGLNIHGIELESELAGNGQLRIAGNFMSGEGQGRLESVLDYSDLQELGVSVRLAGERLQALNLPDVKAVINPEVMVDYDGQTLTINGEVLVPEANLAPFTDLASRVSESPDVVIVGEEENESSEQRSGNEQIQGELSVVLGDAVNLTMDSANLRLGGGVNMVWTGPALPEALGVITVDGTIKAWGPMLRVNAGKIRWANSPVDNPELDVRAERDVFGNTAVRTAGVSVSGNVSSPTIEAFTRPLTTQERAWSVLLTGSDVSYGQGVGALDVGTYIAPRIFLSYGISLFDSDNVVGIRYDLKKGWGVKATSGDRESGVDLSYTIEQGND